jgi:hypothetical protein
MERSWSGKYPKSKNRKNAPGNGWEKRPEVAGTSSVSSVLSWKLTIASLVAQATVVFVLWPQPLACPDHLKRVFVRVRPFKNCRSFFKNSGFYVNLHYI